MNDLLWAWLSIGTGLLLLVGGGELLVRGASRLATAVRILAIGQRLDRGRLWNQRRNRAS